MSLIRAVLLGLVVGACAAFIAELLRPRRPEEGYRPAVPVER